MGYLTIYSLPIKFELNLNDGAEMEKRADGADASVLFFLLGCANFLAVYVQIR